MGEGVNVYYTSAARERERERERESMGGGGRACVCVCVCVQINCHMRRSYHDEGGTGRQTGRLMDRKADKYRPSPHPRPPSLSLFLIDKREETQHVFVTALTSSRLTSQKTVFTVPSVGTVSARVVIEV